jgi:hypothetical protein
MIFSFLIKKNEQDKNSGVLSLDLKPKSYDFP